MSFPEVIKMKTINRITLFVLAFILMAGLFGVGSASAAVDNCKTWHTVRGGEYLIQIARLYEVNWRTIVELNDIENPSRIYPNQKLCISTTKNLTGTSGTSSSGGSVVSSVSPSTSGASDKVYALEVVEDKTVTLVGKSLAANTRYSVYMHRYGGSPTYYAGSVITDSKGAFKHTFGIPKKLVDHAKINVILRSGATTAISNWFINANADDGDTGGIGTPNFSFSVIDVDYGDSVEIRTKNLTPNVTFTVYIGKSGTKGVDGVKVGTLHDNDGTVRATFDIPSSLADRSSLDIRVENKALGVFYYVNFKNRK
jgi:hypothetical protein